jgi:hypothetical protein
MDWCPSTRGIVHRRPGTGGCCVHRGRFFAATDRENQQAAQHHSNRKSLHQVSPTSVWSEKFSFDPLPDQQQFVPTIYQDAAEKHSGAAIPCDFLPDERKRSRNCHRKGGNSGNLCIIRLADARFSSGANGRQGQSQPWPRPSAQNVAAGRDRDDLSYGSSSADRRA